MKRTVVFFLISIIIVLLPLPAYSYDYTFSAQMPEDVNSGRSFDISVTYNGDKPLSGIWFDVQYDNEYFSFRQFTSNDCISDYTDSDGKLSLICLFNKPAYSGETMYFTFTSKTGVPSGEKIFQFYCTQAVSSDLENIDTAITPSLSINVTRKSDSSVTKTETSRRTSTNTSVKTKASSSKTNEASSKTTKSKTSSEFSSAIDKHEENSSYISETQYGTDVSSSVNQTVRLYKQESKSELVIAGAVGMLAVIGIIVGLYKIGKLNYYQPK